MALGSSITGIDISDVAELQSPRPKGSVCEPNIDWRHVRYNKNRLGIGNVNKTADVDKPISTATQTALDGKADKTNTYTKCDVDLNISNLIPSAPESLHTLNELAQALANDQNHATTVFNQLATKATIAYVDGTLALKANQSNTLHHESS